ncbi:MAG: AIPR family protein [Cyanobacteria bacterium P01_D01_bin.156]
MDKITDSLLATFSTEHELQMLPENTRFEHFANYSIISKLNRSTFDIQDVHTGAGGDCAMDGICLIANGNIITDIDELQEIVKGPGYLDADIIFIQSKTTSSFNGSDIGSFIHGVKDFLSDEPRLVQNEKVQQAKVLWDSIISMSADMVNRRPHCRLFYVCTGKWVGDKNLQAIIDSGTQEIDALGLFDFVKITPNGSSEIQRLYRETRNKLSSTVFFQSRITMPDIEGVQEAYLGLMPFNEFIKLIQDENQTIHNIFEDNVRDFQGNNAVNEKIKETLESKKFHLFCLLNNGVTVVASSLTPTGNRLTLRDYQIVNGCQTSNVLHKCQNIDGIADVNIPVKIIVTDSDDIKTEITLATNSQTEVKTEQLEALSAFQKKLELYYNAESEIVRLYYERRSQQYNSLDIKRTQIITIPMQIKAFASVFLTSPHLVSGYYGTIVQRFKDQIFADDHKLLPYFVSSLCYFRIEQFFRGGDLSTDYKKTRFQLMMLVKMISMGCQHSPLNSNRIERECEQLKTELLDEDRAIELFKVAARIFRTSGIDLSKRQYKSESDTDLLRRAAEAYINANEG